ncbi:DUF3137 domain-containing protein [Erythrobacter sp. sf7]|uniref:DUF3137 domain-containing protein n=1 Tax=Erythrobacter fulvus TaxID=2987523 RepID=A0ABT5JLP9_9SPHN|nr:DUF3137 domain-containing protein [Erythrobacter fulvus]MDC8753043.1 DUF3137 domain-containing protein [Erythrobacter fulvus]
MRTNIDNLMQGELGEWLATQTDMRASAKERAASRWTWGAALLLPVLAFLWFGPTWPTGLRVMITFGAAIAVTVWGYQPIADAKKAIKIGINSAIARSFGVAYEHDVEPGAEFEAARRYGLVPSHHRSSFEDRWHGTLEGHAFNLYEAHLEERRGSGKNKRWVTVFRGVIIQLGFGRPFRSTTLLQRAGMHRKWFGLGGTKDSVSFGGHRLDFVDQVHPAFDEKFGLFSDDQVEARVLVHPSYVEHLLKLESAFGAKELRALFARGEVILAVEGKDMFESGSMDAAEDRMRAEEAAEQFAALAGLAVAINQNERGRVLAETRALKGEETAAAAVARPAGGFGRKGL